MPPEDARQTSSRLSSSSSVSSLNAPQDTPTQLSVLFPIAPMPVTPQAPPSILPPVRDEPGTCLSQCLSQSDDYLSRGFGLFYGASCWMAYENHTCCGTWPKKSLIEVQGWNAACLATISGIVFFTVPPPGNCISGGLLAVCSLYQLLSRKQHRRQSGESMPLIQPGHTVPVTPHL